MAEEQCRILKMAELLLIVHSYEVSNKTTVLIFVGIKMFWARLRVISPKLLGKGLYDSEKDLKHSYHWHLGGHWENKNLKNDKKQFEQSHKRTTGLKYILGCQNLHFCPHYAPHCLTKCYQFCKNHVKTFHGL